MAHLALGWTLFGLFLLISFILSWCFVSWLQSVRDGEKSFAANLIVSLCLGVTVVSAVLLPVDVYIVSSMKNADGTFADWAKDPQDRELVIFKIKVFYYVIFGLILGLCFLILPLLFFYHATTPLADDEDEEIEESTGRKFGRALKYTTASIVLFVTLILLGIFLPFEESQSWKGDLKTYFEESWNTFEANKGFEMVSFLINSISVVGLGLLVFYTGIGISSLPCKLIRGTNQVSNLIGQLEKDISGIEERLATLSEHESELNTFEREEMARLQTESSSLQDHRNQLMESSRGCFSTCYRLCRPFQVVFGLVFGLLGMLIFAALILTNIDKAMHSSAKKGYVLNNGTLPNPMDITLVALQKVFPLDYLFYSFMVLFFLITSISGLQQIGIRFMWLPLYKIGAHATKPQALALMSFNLLLMLVSSNVIFFSIAPDYSTYGSQRYVQFDVETNNTIIEHCDDAHAPQDECTATMIAHFLMTFHTKAWIFGAVYYWLIWIFLLVLFGRAALELFQCSRRRVTMPDEEELLNDE